MYLNQLGSPGNNCEQKTRKEEQGCHEEEKGEAIGGHHCCTLVIYINIIFTYENYVYIIIKIRRGKWRLGCYRCSDLIMTTRVRKCRCATSLYLDYYIAPLQPVEAQPAV